MSQKRLNAERIKIFKDALGKPSIILPKNLINTNDGLINQEALDGRSQPRIYTIWKEHVLDGGRKNNNVSFFCLSCYCFGKRGKKVRIF